MIIRAIIRLFHWDEFGTFDPPHPGAQAMNKPTEAHAIVTKLRDQMNERFTEGTATITSAELDALSAALAVEAGADNDRTYAKLETIVAPDNGTTEEVLAAVLECANAWVPEARIIGNVRAGDISRVLSALTTSPSSSGPACVACDDAPGGDNNPCAVCGRSSPASSGVEGEAVALPETPDWPFRFGDQVRKHSGAWWEGRVVGYYSTAATPIGYCVQLATPAHNGPVQIYPLSALSAAPSLSAGAGGEERG